MAILRWKVHQTLFYSYNFYIKIMVFDAYRCFWLSSAIIAFKLLPLRSYHVTLLLPSRRGRSALVPITWPPRPRLFWPMSTTKHRPFAAPPIAQKLARRRSATYRWPSSGQRRRRCWTTIRWGQEERERSNEGWEPESENGLPTIGMERNRKYKEIEN